MKQEFNGKTYHKTGEIYHRNAGARLHRAVWEHHNGAIPDGKHIHHIDFDSSNNDIGNLQLVTPSEHYWLHKPANNPKTWHKSKEGAKFFSSHFKSVWKKWEQENKVCVICGNDYLTWHPKRSLYCSGKCRNKARYIRPE